MWVAAILCVAFPALPCLVLNDYPRPAARFHQPAVPAHLRGPVAVAE